jgi:hypothetical protein
MSAVWQLEVTRAKKSREYFSWLVVRKLFSDDQLKGRNCRGVSNIPGVKKGALDIDKMLIVQGIVFHYFPPVEGEQGLLWRECEKNIDSHLRSKFGKVAKD